MESKFNPINFKIEKFGRSIKAKVNTHTLQIQSKFPNGNLTFNQQKSKQQRKIFQQQSQTQYKNRSSHGLDLDQEDSRSQSMFSNCTIKNVRFSMVINDKSGHNLKKNKSILKNSNSNLSSKNSSMRSLNSHAGSVVTSLPAKQSVKDKGILCENIQYQKIIPSLKESKQKYFDDMFPPGSSSLFYNKKNSKLYQNIRWARIDDIFKGKKLKLREEEDGPRTIILSGQYQSMNYMASCFNAISGSHRTLQRIFQTQQYNRFGIYYLRINHAGIWKYIVIDDFIPVIKNNKGQSIPVFLNVKIGSSKNQICIWPFLLQKALAKMYSCYQCLENDDIQNFMHELTGTVPQKIDLQNELAQYQIRNKLIQKDNITLACSPKNLEEYPQKIYPFYECNQEQKAYFVFDAKLLLINRAKGQKFETNIKKIKQQFKEVYIYRIDDTYYSVGCAIKQCKNIISIRKLVIDQFINCDISLIQKDKKYFRNTGYEYSWARLILVMKEGEKSYRWINGSYKNTKIISLDCYLDPGEYYILIMVDWKNRPYQLNLNFQGNYDVKFIREAIEQHPNILTETCVDLAQRFGSFKQLSRHICSYRYQDLCNGFIIENIHNESRRQMFYYRQYHIQGKHEIIGEKLTQDNELQIFISPQSEYTFILKFLQGPDTNLINNFSYGYD